MSEATDREEQRKELDEQTDLLEMDVPGAEYLIPKNRSRPREKIWKDDDDETNQYFMSEPSLSEDDHSHLRMTGLALPSPQESLSGDEGDIDFSRPTHPPGTLVHQTSQASQPQSASSPGGNTSLSSWDSPHLLGKKIQMHFSSDNKRSKLPGEIPQNVPLPTTRPLYNPSRHVEQPSDLVAAHDKESLDKADRNNDSLAPSSRSTSSVSLGQEQRAADFLNELKLQSIGALQDAGIDDFDSDRNMGKVEKGQFDAVLRSRVSRHHVSPPPPLRPIDHETTPDVSLNMTLSVSEAEDAMGDPEPVDWEQQQSADNDRLVAPPWRIRKLKFGKSTPVVHRRTRSGDAAAATLMTGGTDWRGMQPNFSVVPASRHHHATVEEDDLMDDEKEEEDEDDVTHDLSVLPSQARANNSFSHVGTWCTKPQNERNGKGGTEGFDVDSLGSNYKYRKGRKPPRSRRSLLHTETSSRSLPDPMSPVPQPGSVPLSTGQWYGHQPIDERSKSTFTDFGVGGNSSWNPHNGRDVRLWAFPRYSSFDMRFDSPRIQHGQDEQHTRSSTIDNFLSGVREQQEGFNPHAHPTSNAIGLSRSTFSGISQLLDAPSTHSPQLHRQQQTRNFNSNSVNFTESHEHYTGLEAENSYPENEGVDDSSNEFSVSGRDRQSMEMPFENWEFRDNAQNSMRQRRENAPKNLSSPISLMTERESPGKFQSRALFKPITNIVTEENTKDYATFVCPRCGTRQREFFTVASAGNQFQSPAGYLAVYFTLYVMASLYIFGLDEGWSSLDCVYFAVITLTTAGLGDRVPTSDASKIICSIFIYFGVASIGLLLGSYLAGMMDEKSFKQAQENRLNNCVACSQVRSLTAMEKRRKSIIGTSRETPKRSSTLLSGMFHSERVPVSHCDDNGFANEIASLARAKRAKVHHASTHSTKATPNSQTASIVDNQPFSSIPNFGGSDSPSSSSCKRNLEMAPHSVSEKREGDGMQRSGNPSGLPLGQLNSSFRERDGMPIPLSPICQGVPISPWNHPLLGSPMTAQILDRQSHTRHQSFDVSSATPTNTGRIFSRMDNGSASKPRKCSEDIPSSLPSMIREGIQEGHPQRPVDPWIESDESDSDRDEGDHASQTSETSTESNNSDFMGTPSKIKTAKYVFLTLKEALMNSTLIIAIGSAGFFYIEKMSLVDSFYFTTVLLTTVGYGDIYPVTNAGKLFATIYVLVAGTVLLNNMSLISMIPLELRKRRLERAVLTQFGDQLDDAALRELATGPLVKRLHVSMKRPDGLDECTREMFALAMLVRLGKVTERDVRQTFSAFHRLDVDNDGVLNSRTIIAGMMHKRRSRINVSALSEANESLSGNQYDPTPPPPIYMVPPSPEVYEHDQLPSFEASDGATIGQFWVGNRGSLHVATQAGQFNNDYEAGLDTMTNEEHLSLLNNTRQYGSYTGPTAFYSDQGNDEEVGLSGH